MTPEITVVMATYRQRKYLPKAVESILAHPNVRYLIIVVPSEDKKSLDLAGKLMIEEGQLRIVPTEIKERGMWVQRQWGIDHNPEDYISFFDSDDVMLPGWLEKGLKVAEEIKSRGKIPIVGPRYRMVDEKLFPIQDVILPEFSMGRMMNGSIIPDFSITTTEALRSVGGLFDPDGYDPGHPMYSYSMWLRLLRKYGDNVEVKLLPDMGFLYRQHHKSMHNRFNLTKKKSQENVRRAREVALHYFPELGDRK
jgi:glycosyltransferase involved in cell wall biosynthesis